MAAPPPRLVVVLVRHGVRSPTWDAARLRPYADAAWPDFGVAPGMLTAHGRQEMTILGGYYREWLTAQGLLPKSGCVAPGWLTIWADTDQRTVESGRGLADGLQPGCGVTVGMAAAGAKDPLFAGAGAADAARMAAAVKQRLGSDSQRMAAAHRTALETLKWILSGGHAVQQPLDAAAPLGVEAGAKGAELTGPFADASTLSEDLLLEYADGMQGNALGWGRLTANNLAQVLELHGFYADLMRRTPALAAAGGSNLLAHIEATLAQASSGQATPNAVGGPGQRVLFLVGHDTNQANLAGMLGWTWQLPGYQRDETPPGGALVLTLAPAGSGFEVRAEFVAATLEQIRALQPLTLAQGPERAAVASEAWPAFRAHAAAAIDAAFVQ